MPSFLTELLQETELTARALLDWGSHLINPTVRLGVTGLSRAGKTVFITALVHGLIRGGRFPVFEALAGGRIARAQLAPQPDDAVPRFDYETPCARAHERAALAGLDPADQRAAPRHRLSVAQRRARARSPSTSSIIRASGCSICRCSPRATSNGRRRA